MSVSGAGRTAEEKEVRKNAARLKKARAKRCEILRTVIRAAFFVLMPSAFVAAFSGIEDIFLHVSNGSVLESGSFVRALLGLCLFTVLFGRYFCGFACAFGSFGDFVYWLSGIVQKKVFRRKKQAAIPRKYLPVLQKVKFGILALIVVLCATGLYEPLQNYKWNPWTVFSFLVARRFDLNDHVIGTALLLLILAGMAFQERFFCQVLCPMGAVFALLPQFPFVYLARDPEQCIPGCKACRNRCPVDLKLEADGFRNGECISCEKCASLCPRSNLTRWDIRLSRGAAVPMLVKAVLLLALGGYLGLCRFF